MSNEQNLGHKISQLQRRYRKMAATTVALFVATCLIQQATCFSLFSSRSGFLGASVQEGIPVPSSYIPRSIANLQMRKQKASDRRTRRMQRGDADPERLMIGSLTQSPMNGKAWKHKKSILPLSPASSSAANTTRGRGRARKRSALYNSLSLYHNKFLSLLTEEYKQEEEEVLNRIKASMDDPFGYEAAGFALFDLYPERRGNLFSDEVYRLVKARDATTTFPEGVSVGATDTSSGISNDGKKKNTHTERDGQNATESPSSSTSNKRFFPPNHKFSSNDVIMLTLQPQGTGDFFTAESLPTSGLSIEARVLNAGPTYVDVAVSGGAFEAAFGPAPNNKGPSGMGDSRMRLRADQFFSNIPYQRMVGALSQLTAIPDRQQASTATATDNDNDSNVNKDNDAHTRICMDELLREVILSTHSYSDPCSSHFGDTDFCDLQYLSSRLAKPPMATSQKLARSAISYIRSNSQQIFEEFNEPQLTAINAALTQRLTLIQGPPGTGKTSVAAAIGFGFALQCRSLSASGNAKVLACACSNVGADNLADRYLKLGLKVVRVGRPSAVKKSLWDYTLDAFIDRDEDAQRAVEHAARATAALQASRKKLQDGKGKHTTTSISEDLSRDLATAAVKASIQAAYVAATKALREADVIISTSTGASDPRLLAACGIVTDADDAIEANGRVRSTEKNGRATPMQSSTTDRSSTGPDGFPPLSCPFVIVDESCQSVEPASLIPITSTNSCRSLVLLGDPCQLPPTVRSGDEESPLAESLMARLAAVLPQPHGGPQQSKDRNFNTQYMASLPIRQARSCFYSLVEGDERQQESYRKRFGGANLLSIQYRMHPSIAALPSAIFYDGLLATPAFLASARKFPQVFSQSMPCDDKELCVRLVDVAGRNNERKGALKGNAITGSQSPFFSEEQQRSYWNEQEADTVVELARAAVAAAVGDPSSPRNIGIISPYRGQVDLIKKKLGEHDDLVSDLNLVDIEVKTVDGYQGQERDLIIFSAVRSNRKGSIGFLRDWRRLNVALTRAKAGLIVVADVETLTDGDKHWNAFGKWCHEVGCVFPSKQQQPS